MIFQRITPFLAINKLRRSGVETSVVSFAANYNSLLIHYAVSPFPKNLWFSGNLSDVRRRKGIRNPNPQRHKRQICRNNTLKCSLIDKLLTALLPFLAKNLLFLNLQTQCAEKFLFSCSCRVKQGYRLANPERTDERKFNKHWAHVFGFVMPKNAV